MNLTKRRKQVVIGGILCLGLLMAFQVFVKPSLSRVKTLRRVLTDKHEMLSNLQDKVKDYNALKDKIDRIHLAIENQQKDKKMLSFIEYIQKDCGLTQNVVYIAPTTSTISELYEKTNVEVKYEAVTLNQIIQFLLKIESPELLVAIKSLEIKCETQNPNLLDVVIQLVSVSKIMQN